VWAGNAAREARDKKSLGAPPDADAKKAYEQEDQKAADAASDQPQPRQRKPPTLKRPGEP
jgi:hypothetical protein